MQTRNLHIFKQKIFSEEEIKSVIQFAQTNYNYF